MAGGGRHEGALRIPGCAGGGCGGSGCWMGIDEVPARLAIMVQGGLQAVAELGCASSLAPF